MLIHTERFGDKEIDEDKIITFKDGLLGFRQNRRFIILTEDDMEICLIWWLQSVDEQGLAFPVLNTFALLENYLPEVDDALLSQLGRFGTEDLVVCNILVVPEKIENMTVNLKAPLVINATTKKGMQIIVNNSEYEVRHAVYEEIKKHNERTGE